MWGNTYDITLKARKGLKLYIFRWSVIFNETKKCGGHQTFHFMS